MSRKSSPAAASAAPFLKGCKIYILGYGSNARNAAEAKIRAAGGAVAAPIAKVASIFAKSSAASKSSAALPESVTHLLCGMGSDYKHRSPSSILSELGVASLPPAGECKVVVGDWLTQSIIQGKRLEEAPFEIDMTAKPPAPAPSPPAGLKRAAAEEGGPNGSTGGKRPRPEASAAAEEGGASLPPPPPLLSGMQPQPVPRLSENVPMNHTWVKYGPLDLLQLKVNGGHALGETQGAGPVRIAAFDLDSTLVKVRSGKTFPQHAGDWEWLYPQVPAMVRDLHAQGYHLYVVSNQKGISSSRVKLTYTELTQRASAVVAALGLPEGARVEGFFATHDNVFSKPRPGMWYLLEDKYGGANNIDLAGSMYVGDAAGRPGADGWRKDFSDSDLKFAVNADLPFKTPEELFLNKTRQGMNPQFHSGAALAAALRSKAKPLDGYLLASSAASAAAASAIPTTEEQEPQQEAVILVGPAASGKSSFCAQRLPGHTRVNQDTLKTLDKCRQAAREALHRGESLVVDSTNAPSALRREWVAFLRQAHESSSSNNNGSNGLRVRAVEFRAPESAVLHLNCFRGINPDSHDPRLLPYPALKGIINRLERVAAAEGFDHVEEVRGLAPGPFRHARERHLFFCWLGTK